jgi:hypothetical protein
LRRLRHRRYDIAGGAFLSAIGLGDGRVDVSDEAHVVYRRAAQVLLDGQVPFLVGGAFALAHYTPVARDTKDFDLFIRPRHLERALATLEAAGFSTKVPFPHWLGKACDGDIFIDIIFSSGNGVALVDDEWFEQAQPAPVLGLPLQLCPAEEMIWSKAFVLERERFDGADVLHLVRDCGPRLDWERLLRRFGRFWRVLYAHLVLFGFVFPGHRESIPDWVMGVLARKLGEETGGRPDERELSLCQGTLLSREQYLTDIERLGYRDVRLLHPDVNMSEQDVAKWTGAIPGRGTHGRSEPGGHR